MTDFWDGLIKELPISAAANIPWNWVLFALGAFFLLKSLGIFALVSQML